MKHCWAPEIKLVEAVQSTWNGRPLKRQKKMMEVTPLGRPVCLLQGPKIKTYLKQNQENRMDQNNGALTLEQVSLKHVGSSSAFFVFFIALDPPSYF